MTLPDDPPSRSPQAEAPRERPRDRAIRLLVDALMLLPFGLRRALAYRVGRLAAGRSRSSQRVHDAIRHFLPDLPEPEITRIATEAQGNFARMIVEVLSASDMATLAASLPIEGPGLTTLDEAHAQGRPVILVSAHFGNYDAWRLALIHRGFAIGGYFKELGNPVMNARYVEAVSASGQPMFPDTGEGLRSLVKFLRKGGMLGILMDLDRPNGVMLDFLGRPTRTVLSMAEMALRYDAPLVPIWGIRTKGQPGFRVQVDAPVPPSDPETMTQALNDAFAAQVRAHPGQWVWWHNRRKADHP